MMPDTFTRAFLTPCPRHITISTTDNRTWPATMECHIGRIYISKGWQNFKAHYGIKGGALLDVLYDRESHFTIYLVSDNTRPLSDKSIGSNPECDPRNPAAHVEKIPDLRTCRRKRSRSEYAITTHTSSRPTVGIQGEIFSILK